MLNTKDASRITSSTTLGSLSKYLVCGAAGALAFAPLGAHAADVMKSNTTTTTTTTTTVAAPAVALSADPVAVSGTVSHYYVDRSGYVTAMEVQTATGSEWVHFPANRAAGVYGNYPTGGTIDLWVVPGAGKREHQWTAVGTGKDRPDVWWNVVNTTDVDWLSAEPYIDAGAKETTVTGRLKSVITDHNGEILALAIDGSKGKVLVRVPPQVRQIAPGYRGDARVTPLFKNAYVVAVGTPEAPRKGGLAAYNWYLASNSMSIDGDNVGAIGLPALKRHRSDTLLDWNVGGSINNDMLDKKQHRMRGYQEYMPVSNDVAAPAETTTNTMTTTKSTTTETQTGRVMIVAADGSTLPVVKKGGRMYAQAADGMLSALKKRDGKYVVPDNMTGARMMMVMADGSKMDMDTVNGRLMVKMPDGSMAPVTLHTP